MSQVRGHLRRMLIQACRVDLLQRSGNLSVQAHADGRDHVVIECPSKHSMPKPVARRPAETRLLFEDCRRGFRQGFLQLRLG
jgi:hypothetical protein